jgi:hypothetical protein
MPDPIDLNRIVQTMTPVRSGRTDTVTVTVPAGKLVKLETTPGGVEIASGTVPVDKVWEIDFIFAVVERDA